MAVHVNGRIPADAIAVVANVTAVEAERGGFVTAYPIGQSLPLASNLNYGPGDVGAAAVMVKLGTSSGKLGFNLYTMSRAHLVVDIMGYISGPKSPSSSEGLFVPVDPQRLLDTRSRRKRVWPGVTVTCELPKGIAPRARSVAMNLTVTSSVSAGYFTPYAAQTPRRVVSSLNVVRPGQTIANQHIQQGLDGGCCVLLSEGAHVIADVAGGDELIVLTSDQRRYRYRMVAEYVTSKYANDILGTTRRIDGETVSLVACSKTNRLPTSLEHRLISTFSLVGWDDLG